MAGEFQNKVVWITGGGTGIGRALAVEFAQSGAVVAVSGRRVEPLEAARDAIDEAGGEGMAVPCDVTKVTELEEAVEAIVGKHGRLDVTIANAGFSVSGKFEELSAADWKRQFDTNVVGVAMTAKMSLPHLRETDGRLVLMGSVAGTVGLPESAPYSASKFAVRGIGQSLTASLADSGVSCTTLLPGFVESQIGKVDNRGEFREDWEDRRSKQLMWSAERAAQSMYGAIKRRRSEAVITGHGKFVAFLGNHAPRLTQNLIGRFG